MALTAEVNKKVVTIKTEAGGTYLIQSFDPTQEGFTPFASDAAAQSWADAWIAAEEAEQAEKLAAEEAKKAAWAEEEQKALDTRELVAEEPTEE